MGCIHYPNKTALFLGDGMQLYMHRDRGCEFRESTTTSCLPQKSLEICHCDFGIVVFLNPIH
jgi:hypothetical protein